MTSRLPDRSATSVKALNPLAKTKGCHGGDPDYSAATSAERWPSGLRRPLGKRVYGKPYRGFESLPLRHVLSETLFSAHHEPLYTALLPDIFLRTSALPLPSSAQGSSLRAAVSLKLPTLEVGAVFHLCQCTHLKRTQRLLRQPLRQLKMHAAPHHECSFVSPQGHPDFWKSRLMQLGRRLGGSLALC